MNFEILFKFVQWFKKIGSRVLRPIKKFQNRKKINKKLKFHQKNSFFTDKKVLTP